MVVETDTRKTMAFAQLKESTSEGPGHLISRLFSFDHLRVSPVVARRRSAM
jgi:hypothetical protein